MSGRARVRARGMAPRHGAREVGSTPGNLMAMFSSPGGSQASSSGASDISQSDEVTVSSDDSGRSFMERGQVRPDFVDLSVCTREKMAHVKDCKTGSSGIPLRLVTNLFSLDLPQDWQLYQYHVTYSPDLASRRLKIALLYSHSKLVDKTKAFDGTSLFLSEKLDQKVTELTCDTQRGETVRITLTLTSQLLSTSPVCIHFFNIIFKKLFKKLKMYQIGRNFYKPSEPVEIPQYKLSLWPGFAFSVSHFENRLLLNADVSYKVLRNETVLEFMTDLCLRAGTSHFTETCQKQLVGLIVLTRYNNKTYRIDDIDWSVKPTQAFQKRDGSEITYMDYYKQQYNITLSDLNQPVLVSLLKRKRNDNTEARMVHLIPELCFLTGMSSQATSDFHLMRAVAEETRLSPMARQQQLARLVDDMQRDQVARFELESWGLQFGNQLSLTGRVVPSEKILLHDHTCHPASAADWSKDMRSCRVLSSEPLNRWLVICCSRAENLIEGLLSCLRRVGGPMGFNVSYPKIIKVDERPAAFLRAIQLHVDPDVQLVMCILPSNQKNYYDSIKKYLSFDCPIPSQCVLSRTLTKQGMMMSVATKIALQMTCKLGGELWAVEIPLKSLMVVGVDICRDALNKDVAVVGFVASINSRITRWFSRCVLQRRAADIADCLKVCMTGALNKWYKYNHDLPSRIIVYRDGVGNGQLKAVLEYEIPQLLSSVAECGSGASSRSSSTTTNTSSSTSSISTSSISSISSSSGSGSSSRLSVVVVRKRCLLRFFSETDRTVKNPPLGTVVDSEATRTDWYDFYLVSQTTNRGTVSPTYYNVIYDDNGLKPDHMQRLTFKLCHLYYNWQGLISVPAPCQYAHKLTFLVAQSIHKEPSLELANNLFYL